MTTATNRVAVVYCSQTGFTKRYADWIAEEFGCSATPFEERSGVDLAKADAVVFCSWFHAGGLKNANWAKEQMERHGQDKFVVVGVGATPMPCDDWPAEDIATAMGRAFPPEQHPGLAWFYCQGGFDFQRLSLPDKLAMRLFFKMMGKQAKDSAKDAEALASMKRGFDATDRANLAPAIAHVKSLLER